MISIMFKQLTTKTVIAAGAATVAISAVSAPAEAASFTVTVEAPGVNFQSSQVTPSVGSLLTENWDTQPTNSPATYTSTLGTYTANDQIAAAALTASPVGGAGGTGQYVGVTNLGAGVPATLTLDLTTPQKYFGLWWSAVDAANKIEFFRSGTSLFSFDAAALVSYVAGTPGYIGNPNPNQSGSTEPFAFVNFFAGTGTDFDRIVFTNSSTSSRFESDNHTVAQDFGGITGTPIPTPAMLPGLISMGIAAWRKRKAEAAESEV